MIPLKKKQLLDNFVIFFKKKCYWMGKPIIIINYIKNEKKFFTIVESNNQFNSFNIYLSKDKYWETGKCRKTELIEHINYLSNNLITTKHEILYNSLNFRILLLHPQE